MIKITFPNTNLNLRYKIGKFEWTRSWCHKQILEEHSYAEMMLSDWSKKFCDLEQATRVRYFSIENLCYFKLCLWHWLPVSQIKYQNLSLIYITISLGKKVWWYLSSYQISSAKQQLDSESDKLGKKTSSKRVKTS